MTLIENYHAFCTEITGHNSKAQLVAVSKGRSIEQVLELYEAGCRNFGENRVQELIFKWELLPKDIRWHFIGPVQKNKVSKLVGKCCCIHSVNSIDLAEKIGKSSLEQKTISSVLLQVNVSREKSKQGFSLEELDQYFEEIKRIQGIQIDGLMTMAPFIEDRDKIRLYFRVLREIRDYLNLAHLSMGMSHDYKIALEEGATLIRIGSALFEN